MSQFGRNNISSGQRKLTAERVVEIYKMCQSGMTQGAIARETGISVGQIGRILRGESWQELYRRFTNGLPLDTQNTSMYFVEQRLNAATGVGVPPASEQAIAASLAKFQEQLAKESAPRPSVLEILENRAKVTHEHEQVEEIAPAPTALRKVPTLEEIEARERAAMGLDEGAGLKKLTKSIAETRPALNAEKLLETLTDEHSSTTVPPATPE